MRRIEPVNAFDARRRGKVTLILDMVVDDRVIVENKAAEKLSRADRMQLISYRRATSFDVGVLLHVGPFPQFARYIDHPKQRHR
jgi:GxxExxY protein